jgi:hypothetical protein
LSFFLIDLELPGLAAAGLALIRVQRPLGEATRLWGRKRLAVFYSFFKNTNARSCVKQVCCKFGSVPLLWSRENCLAAAETLLEEGFLGTIAVWQGGAMLGKF